jgi:glycosyltransferase involved in cell wall biosynthesis
MKIALCSTFVPFVYGGGRNIVEWLQTMLEKHGHDVERVYLPQVDAPDLLFQQMMALRWIDLKRADRIICFRPQSHLIPHHHKIIWFIHHIRLFYDLWDSPYRGFPDDLKHKGIREALQRVDNAALREAKTIYTNSKVVSDRLTKYNQINSEVLYPPVFQAERFYRVGYNNEIVYISRLEHHKRQHLLIEAMKYVKTPVHLRICGIGMNSDYPLKLKKLISKLEVSDRVTMDNGWISETKKIELLSNCLAAAYVPLDEDSYGYPSVEASHASKPILTTSDSGGVLELIQNDINGYVSEPEPKALAKAMDELYLDKDKAKIMGNNAHEQLGKLNISWDHVLEKLLS